MGLEPRDAPRDDQWRDWVLDAVPDGLWVLDDDGRTLYANARLVEMLGLAPDEVDGFYGGDALDEEGRASFIGHLGDLAAGRGSAIDVECLLFRRDGTSFWAQVTHVPIGDGAGHGWLHRVRDNTEQRALIDAMRRREADLADAQSIARIGSWERDLSAGTMQWSEELYRVVGRDPATFEPTSENFQSLLHPDDRDLAAKASASMLDEGADVVEIDVRLDRPPGEPTAWIRARGQVARDADGQINRISGTVQDITESKESEQGLAFLSAMAGAANESRTLEDALLAADTVVRPYTQWPALVVSAPDPDQPEALVHFDTGWADVDDEDRAFARAVAEEVAATRATIQRVGPRGTFVVGGPAIAGDRVACIIVSDSRSATDPRPYELAIFRQMLALLATVSQREQIAHQLSVARDEALAASRAKSEFLATMSHEIRTPLNGVIGLSELLSRTALDGHQRRLAQGLDQAGRTLLSLVNDILDLSKIEAGRLDLEEVDFDPRLVLEQSVGLLAERAAERGLELAVSCGDVPTLVNGDPVRFGQVVTNLVANAVKFTHQGEVVVRAEGMPGSTSGLRVEVRDTGIGIAPEVRNHLFDAFSQADSSTTREYGGTGLGLAICRRIVDAIGGEIGVDSEVGEGSTFWFTAPLAPATEPEAPSEAALRDAVAGLRVLVVDDNATNRFILAEQLTAWDVHVTAVDSAYEALLELDASARRAAPYDIGLLDYMMPGADGEQLARIIRGEERHRGLRLALLSSSMEPDGSFLVEAGIDAFLSKPVLPTRLLELVASLSGRLDGAVLAPVLPLPTTGAASGRLLVAEDNPINQMVAEGILSRLGYELVVVENGAAAVAAVADDPDGFDAILMDCQMPVMDGFDATRAIRAMGGTLPIIAMTAATIDSERERCREAGMDDFLSKPVVPDLLATTLATWVTGERRTPEPAAAPEPAPAPARSRLQQLVDEGIAAAAVLRMADRFVPLAVDAMTALTVAVEGGDADQVRRTAHSLKGSAGNLGLTALADACAVIEADAGNGLLPDEATLADLRAAVDAGAAQLAADADALRH